MAADATLSGQRGGAPRQVKASEWRRWLRRTLAHGQCLREATSEIFGETYGAFRVSDQHGRTPLHVAVDFGWPDAAAALLTGGADPCAADNRGQTAAHCAAASGAFDTPDAEGVLLQLCGGRPAPALFSRDAAGRTPLHAAAMWGRAHTADLLLRLGADPSAVDGEGRTAHDYASRRGMAATCATLVQRLRAASCAATLSGVSAAVAVTACLEHITQARYEVTAAGLMQQVAQLGERTPAPTPLSGQGRTPPRQPPKLARRSCPPLPGSRTPPAASPLPAGGPPTQPQFAPATDPARAPSDPPSVPRLPDRSAEGQQPQQPAGGGAAAGAAPPPPQPEEPAAAPKAAGGGGGRSLAKAFAAAALRPKHMLGGELLAAARQTQLLERQSQRN